MLCSHDDDDVTHCHGKVAHKAGSDSNMGKVKKHEGETHSKNSTTSHSQNELRQAKSSKKPEAEPRRNWSVHRLRGPLMDQFAAHPNPTGGTQ